MKKPFHVALLELELRRRKEKNPRYSLRAFASFLKLDPSALSRILSGKQELSTPSALQIIRKLKLTDRDQERFILSLAEEKYRQALSALRQTLEASPRHLEAEKEPAEFRNLLNTMNEGFCVMEKIPTPPGAPSDFRYLEANQAFERHTGLSGVVGKTVRQAIPWAEEPILARYDRVVQTGKPELFEGYVSARDLWLEIGAYPIRSPGQVALIFRNISERKRTEAALRALEAERRV